MEEVEVRVAFDAYARAGGTARSVGPIRGRVVLRRARDGRWSGQVVGTAPAPLPLAEATAGDLAAALGFAGDERGGDEPG
jgi:hypothetical protein